MTDSTTADTPRIVRQRHEPRRRNLTVLQSERLTPHMQRITLHGDLTGFQSLAPDDHIKVIVGTEPDLAMRDYTPRRHDVTAGELVVDFALHQAGPATDWAMQAQAGDTLTVGGPRGSQQITGPIAHWLLVGDETALPAIGRWIEEAAPETRITAVIAVPGPADEQQFETAARVALHWVHRPESAAADPAPVLAALAGVDLPAQTFAWIAAEAGVTRALRAHLLETRGHPLHWLKAKGYWVRGQADTTETFD